MVPDWETRLEILRKWQSGETQKSLASRYQLSLSRISQICQDARIKLKRGWEPEDNLQPGRPSEGKRKTTVSFDPDVWEKVKDLGWGDRSKVLNQALREYLGK